MINPFLLDMLFQHISTMVLGLTMAQPMKTMWEQCHLHHPPVISILMGFKPFTNGWFMALFYPHLGIRLFTIWLLGLSMVNWDIIR